jgi:prepilin-type N-terminal cleavage/methylation domain-containing protein
MSRPTSRRGFTLLEIMVALTVGGIALGSLYAVGSASQRHFRQQQRISATQTSLRAAMDELKHDFQRAGFMSTPNSQMAGETCSQTMGVDGANQLAAEAGLIKRDTRPDSLDPDTLNDATYYTTDDVWLTGNYATSGEYPGITLESDGKTVDIPMNWQSFRRDFTVWSGLSAGTCVPEAFEAAFPVGRMVRLHGLTERNFYSYVDRTTCTGADTAQIVLTSTVPAVCNMTGGWIAPVSFMRYWVTDTSAAEGTRVGANRVSVLRRTEVKPGQRTAALTTTTGTTPIDDRAILDYVVRFNVDFMLRIPTNANIINFVPATDIATIANPERVRGAIIDLVARTAEHEPEFFSDLPHYSFKVFPTRGAARVRRAHAEVLMPNIAYRQL